MAKKFTKAPEETGQPSLLGKPTIRPVTAKVVRERYYKGLKATMYERREYWINYAFMRGRQWIYWNRQTQRIDDLGRQRGRYQATIDRLSPSTRTIMSKLLQRELKFEVPPTGADDDTIQGARTSEAVLRSLHQEHDWERLREEVAHAVWIGGTAAICVDWDPYAGDSIQDDESEGDMYTGDVCETVLTIPEFVVEPGSKEAEKARWWIKGVVLPPETVQALYGLAKEPPVDAESSMSPYNARVITSDETALNLIDGTLVLTYYERPNALNPKGSVVTVVDSQIVDNKEWPFPFRNKLNIAVIRETPINGRWTGETILSKAAKVQVSLNAAWSNYLEHLKKVGAARLLIPASQMEMADVLSDDPGKPIKFLDGPGAVLPKYLEPPQLPAWIINSITELRSEMDDIIGIHDASRGAAPTNIESGKGVSALQEGDDTPIGRLNAEMCRLFGKVGTMDLKLLETNVQDKQKAVIHMGGNRPPMTVPWDGKSLAGQTTAVVPAEATLPRSRAEQFALAERLVQMRPDWFPNIAAFMRVAELPSADEMLWALNAQEAKAERNNHMIAEGKIVIPQEFDNHEIMINRAIEFQLTPRYEQLDAQIKHRFDIYKQGHQSMAEEQMGQQVAKGMASPALAATPTIQGAPQLPLAQAGAMPGQPTGGPLEAEPPGAPQAPPEQPQPIPGG